MKNILLIIVINLFAITFVSSQGDVSKNTYAEDINDLINQYIHARESQDTILLKSILTPNIDQLVSTGEWRKGIRASVQGMKRSSESRPGSRILTIEKIRLLNPETAIVDARYEIENADHSIRKMWSTFIVVYQGERWRITAIRNMLPAP